MQRKTFSFLRSLWLPNPHFGNKTCRISKKLNSFNIVQLERASSRAVTRLSFSEPFASLDVGAYVAKPGAPLRRKVSENRPDVVYSIARVMVLRAEAHKAPFLAKGD